MPIKLNAAQAKAMGVIPPRKPSRTVKGASKLIMCHKVNQRLFQAACASHGLPEPVSEHTFHPKRSWRFDWCWKEQMVALEVDGGVWTQGRHLRGAGFLGDIDKLNQAVILGWKVLRCTPQDVKSGRVFELLREVLL